MIENLLYYHIYPTIPPFSGNIDGRTMEIYSAVILNKWDPCPIGLNNSGIVSQFLWQPKKDLVLYCAVLCCVVFVWYWGPFLFGSITSWLQYFYSPDYTRARWRIVPRVPEFILHYFVPLCAVFTEIVRNVLKSVIWYLICTGLRPVFVMVSVKYAVNCRLTQFFQSLVS